MTVTADMIITRRGTVLPLDQRRRDALMTYAQQAADDAGIPRQTWVRKVWGLQPYEAKDLLKGNASEVVWERILKRKGPHCGWSVVIPVMAAVIGQPIHQFFREAALEAAKEAADAVAHEKAARTAWDRLEGRSFDPGPDRASGAAAGGVEPAQARSVAR